MTDSPNVLPTDADRTPAPDMLGELGPLAYGLVVLSEIDDLADVSTLSERQAAQLPSQVERTVERDARSEALLGELGALDL
ncbi:hypothetical protein [Sporichthya polymorpha]|uniref:hypothetical protein n=1 Tax=Sporichthya polymorpha TaxID=35751 RepID=UPI00035F5FF3|nr:hypothetical protein [Sporichthya polymorpha]